MADTLNQKLNRAIDQIKVIDDKTKTKLKGKTYTTVAARNEISVSYTHLRANETLRYRL